MRSATAVWLMSLWLLSSAQDDLDSLIKQVFNQPETTTAGNREKFKEPQIYEPEPQPDPDVHNTGLGGDECTCVPYYLCANNTVITDGRGLLDIRTKGECESYMDVCCKEPRDPTDPIKPQKNVRRGCGTRNIDGVGFRITGALDNEAQYGEFPWMVAILKVDLMEDGKDLKVYQCGGALIHQQVVMTAAHCVASFSKNPSHLRVRAGEWDTQTKNELYPHQDRDVVQVVVHEKYYAGGLYNDIALLILKDPVDLAENVDIVCLPKQNDVVLQEECYASGWGKDVFGKDPQPTQPSTLKPNRPPSVPSSNTDGTINEKIIKFQKLFGNVVQTTVRPVDQDARDKVNKFQNLFGTKKVEIATEPTYEPMPNEASLLDVRFGQGDEPSPENSVNFPGKKGQYQVILKKIDLPMVNRDKCQNDLRKTRLGQHFRLHDSFVCAGGIPGKDTCKGDGGSPLVCAVPGERFKYQQVGIVAWGIGCGNETPAVYVNVALFRNWIDHHFKQFNFIPEYSY